MKNILMLPLALSGALFSSSVLAAEPNIIICNSCSSGASFAARASSAFDNLPPRNIALGTKEVFLINLQTDAMHFYRVTRSYDSPNGDPVIGDFFVTAARLSTPPADDGRDVGDALVVLDVFLREFANEIPADDLGLSFGSAVDLVGQNNTAAGLNRNDLNNALSNHFLNFSASLLGNVNDTVSRIVSRFIGESGINGSGSVIVVFGDGSKVRVFVANIGADLTNPDLIVVTLSVDPNSVTVPGRNSIPQSGGQLGGFNMTSSDDDLSESLRRLFDRLGANTTTSSNSGSSGSGGGCTRFSCTTEGSEISCEVVMFSNCNPYTSNQLKQPYTVGLF